MSDEGILLEAGTNELEIVVFTLGETHFGVNAAKIQEILKFDSKYVSKPPEGIESVIGYYSVRGSVLTLVDLNLHLKRPPTNFAGPRVVLLSKFNNTTTAFLVDGIKRINRMSWEALTPVPHYLAQFDPRITSSVQIEDEIVQMLDLEHIVGDLDPQAAFLYENEKPPASQELLARRGGVRVFFAEDSIHIRERMTKTLVGAGYTQVTGFNNGEGPHLAVRKLAQEGEQAVLDAVQVVITDIEMPGMDGLALCRNLKKELKLDKLKVFLFSSLIDEQMGYKCMEVGADGYVSKPQGNQVVELLDEHCLGVREVKAAA